MKIFAQLIEPLTGRRSPAVSGTKEELACVFMNEWRRRLDIADEVNANDSDDVVITHDDCTLFVLVLMDNVQSPADMQFSTCPLMTVNRFYRWVFPMLDLPDDSRADISADRVVVSPVEDDFDPTNPENMR